MAFVQAPFSIREPNVVRLFGAIDIMPDHRRKACGTIRKLCLPIAQNGISRRTA